MNKKFSTLMAAFLAAGSFVNVDAGVVKVATPVAGKSYVIAQADDVTKGSFVAGKYALTSDGTDVTVGTIAQGTTSLTDFTKWVFGEIVAANQYKITYGDKYLRVADSNTAMELGEEGSGSTRAVWVVSSRHLGASDYNLNSADATNMIKFTAGVAPSVGLVTTGTGEDDIAFYAENYDGTEVDKIGGMDFNLKNSVAANEFVFIKIGDKFVSVKADGTGVEMVSADALKTTEGKFRATFKVSGTTKYLAVAATNQTNGFLKAGTADNGLDLAAIGSATEFFFDNSNTYIGQKGASMYTLTGAENYIGVDGKTTAIGATTPSQRPEVKIYKSSNILMAPASATNPLISAEGFVSGGKYLLSANGAKFQSASSVNASGEFTLAPVDADEITDDAIWEVKEVKDASDNYSYTLYNVGKKAFLKFDEGTETFISGIDKQGYTGGFQLLSITGKALNSGSLGADAADLQTKTVGSSNLQTFGLYSVGTKAYTAAELNNLDGTTGFTMTIDVEKDKKADVKGADMFAGKLTAVGTNNYRLKTADGKYIVLLQDDAKNPTWGTGDLDGKHQFVRGYKFAAVKEADIKNNLSYFRISHAAASDSKDLIVEVMTDALGSTDFGRLYIAEVNGEYMLTTTKGMEATDVYPYVVAGSNSAVKIKDLVKGRFVNISYVNSKKVTGAAGNLDRFGKVYTVGLDADGEMAVSYAKLNTEVLASSPETQWAITGTDGSITFANREQPTVKLENKVLFSTATPNVYAIEDVHQAGEVTFRDTIRLSYVEDINMFDGFMFAKENQLRNQRYNLSAINMVGNVTQKMFWAENQGTHKIGLDGKEENAGKWKLSFDKKDLVVDGVTTENALIDTVLVISNVSIIKDNKVVTVPDTLAILPYIFQNADNDEYVKYNDTSLEAGDFYICDKYKVEANATRFALKVRPDNTYHFVTLNATRNSGVEKATDYANPFENKIYAGSSTNLLNHVANYTVKGNDLMAVTPLEVPEYRQVAFGDTIRIYREENDSQVMYEKRDASVLVEGQAPSFLNIDNVNQFTKINPAIFVDTAYVNREAGENTRYQYLLAVNVEEKTDAVCPLNPEHNTQAWRDEHNNGKPCPDAVKSNYVRGRYLINLMDTANVYEAKQLHSNNPYIDRNEAGEPCAKLAFVEGYHLNDTLFIQRGNGEYVKLELGDANFNIAKFAFHYVDYAAGTFKIQTQHKNWKEGDLDVKDEVSNDGYLKWINGTVVVTEGFDQGDVFNLNEDETRIPTANEGINASEVSVIAKEGAVIINGAQGKKVTISNVLGQTVANTVLSSDNATLSAPAGIVVVAVEGEAAVKAIVK